MQHQLNFTENALPILFPRYDIDSDGIIDLSEIIELMHEIYRLHCNLNAKDILELIELAEQDAIYLFNNEEAIEDENELFLFDDGISENNFIQFGEYEIIKMKVNDIKDTTIIPLTDHEYESENRMNRKAIFLQCLYHNVTHIEDPYSLHRTVIEDQHGNGKGKVKKSGQRRSNV